MRKIIAFFLCLMMVSGALTAMAAEESGILTAYETVDSDLMLYGVALPKDGELTVTIKDQKIEDAQLSTVRQENVPVTVYCLVDLSTHMGAQQVQQQIDALNIISSRMGENDNMVITTVGKKITEGAVLTTFEARRAAIETLKHDVYNVDFYAGVAAAVNSLETNTSYNTNRCLLILADGIVYGNAKTPRKKAAEAIGNASYPVYVLAATGRNPSQSATKDAQNILKLIGSAPGGLGLIPANEGISAAQAAEKIWENIQESAVIRIDLQSVQARDNNTTVHTVYEAESTRYEGSAVVDLAGVITETESAELTEIGGENGSGESENQPQSWLQEHMLTVGIAAAAMLVLLVVLAVVLARGKKKNISEEPQEADVPEPTAGVDDDVIMEEDFLNDRTESATGAYPTTTPAVAPGPEITVQLAITTHQDVKVSFTLHPNMVRVLGRDDRADIIVNAEDSQLSGRHCTVEWDGNYLCVQDIGSTNGTYINSVLLKPHTWNRLQNGSVVTMGSFDYAVTIIS